jgi:hypothetical protein
MIYATYLSFAAIARCSIPVQKPPAFLSDLLPNFLRISKWKYSVRIWQLCLRTPARRALRGWTHCRAWNLVPVHAEKIQKYSGAPIQAISKPKVNISSRQVIDLLYKNVYARMIQTRPSVWPPFVSLWNGSRLWNGRHHSQQAPCKWFACNSPVVVATGNCMQEEMSYTCHIPFWIQSYLWYNTTLWMTYTNHIHGIIQEYEWHMLIKYYS